MRSKSIHPSIHPYLPQIYIPSKLCPRTHNSQPIHNQFITNSQPIHNQFTPNSQPIHTQFTIKQSKSNQSNPTNSRTPHSAVIKKTKLESSLFPKFLSQVLRFSIMILMIRVYIYKKTNSRTRKNPPNPIRTE